MLGYFGQAPSGGRTPRTAALRRTGGLPSAPTPPGDYCSIHGMPNHRCAVSKSDEEAQAAEAPKDARGSSRPTPFTLRK